MHNFKPSNNGEIDGILARPKDSTFDYRPVVGYEQDMYALQFILGSGWTHTVWYYDYELDFKEDAI